MSENFIDIKGAAEFLGCHINTVKRRVAESRAGLHAFPFHQDVPGGNLSFLSSELKGWRNSRKIEREIRTRKEMASCLSIAKS
jgi:hypothetical protein